MRIIAGKWRGKAIQAPPGAVTRPTADRMREALFSMLTSRLGSFEGLKVLDGFAGTGALGLEALSRGASRAWFVESDPAAVKALKANIAAMSADGTVVASPMATLGKGSAACDLVLLDPPYGESLALPTLLHLQKMGWIAPFALVSVETGAKEALETDWEILAVRKHGKAAVHLLRAPG
ncbi:16S rRNA (guanine(966)-N(2))-methyltransferase RsmD [Sandarakinorhabdus sp.]|uniref:16S rRNA (guanine(966)-N(2))-methyltransferase RsmD n=1 Tax=Sandarakinorhabdus sp. TaxID=1916663 RepID=UPI00286E57AC|nr:16S rRNA (guanine(966)-N(2))-methyltransferase RsmD [Sandarakinorhabdus sp.]